ncbi:gluconate 2-dehydrogenase subunit 3 family protein [Teichococcus vastitatis]|uniref:Gluconate 2-dehydrogenase subunit 3 family protein n=1 Tax=Teichococcus vastitatis TaxID=2307076 RepID=A0ABS9W213_9PROT|nr:gluconate 2-dehydrogenase subunit 3 family protein [Pseudoroseomonas vastitatis]MCI0753242.1 gluconate 2-dehydrogenase subunit 3 family protein [Pseudoroseomonas vastitatis]
MPLTTRRQLLSATALVATTSSALGRSVTGRLPWSPNEAYPPELVRPGGWMFLRPEEVATLEAIVSRLIPADDLSPSGQDAGCTVFIDRQLAGPWGTYEWYYMQGPFAEKPLPTQGIQSPLVPQQQYRTGLAALAAYCRENFAARTFEQLSAAEQDKLLAAMEKGEVQLPGLSAPKLTTTAFFNLVLQNTMEGFFADPIYGGNKDMASWKMIGFPGVRYDYRDVLANPGKPYTKPPVAIMGRPDWNGRPA